MATTATKLLTLREPAESLLDIKKAKKAKKAKRVQDPKFLESGTFGGFGKTIKDTQTLRQGACFVSKDWSEFKW